MNVRPYEESDLAVLKELFETAAYGFPFPDNISDYLVVTDDAGCPIMAAGEKLIPEITLICAPGGSTHPLVKLKGVALIHDALRDRLVSKGFTQAIASVPPSLGAYQRHLQRHFKWRESWPTFRIEDWKGGS